MNVALGVQCRTSSTRLPGKVMMDLGERPMILQLWSRVTDANVSYPCRAVLTSRESSDDQLVRVLEEKHIPVRRGSLSDVRSRFIDLACYTKADIIVRVCGDCPFIDPLFINLAIRICEMHPTGACLVRAKEGSLMEGVDVFTTKALFDTLDNDEPENLEHCGLPAMEAEGGIQKVVVGMGREYQNPKITKLSIDTAEDMKFAQRFWEHLARCGRDLRKAISTWG